MVVVQRHSGVGGLPRSLLQLTWVVLFLFSDFLNFVFLVFSWQVDVVVHAQSQEKVGRLPNQIAWQLGSLTLGEGGNSLADLSPLS